MLVSQLRATTHISIATHLQEQTKSSRKQLQSKTSVEFNGFHGKKVIRNYYTIHISFFIQNLFKTLIESPEVNHSEIFIKIQEGGKLCNINSLFAGRDYFLRAYCRKNNSQFVAMIEIDLCFSSKPMCINICWEDVIESLCCDISTTYRVWKLLGAVQVRFDRILSFLGDLILIYVNTELTNEGTVFTFICR